jgi:exonuclease VII large subunit
MNASKLVIFPLAALILVVGLAAHAVGAEAPAGDDQDMTAMQMHMDKMRQQMAKIRSTKDPQERRRLMNAHMQQVHEAMGMMSQNMMPKMKKRMHSHSHAPGNPRQSQDAGNSEQHMAQMEQMMRHMEAMLEQMSQHQELWSEAGEH